jgi:hypothetical protein
METAGRARHFPVRHAFNRGIRKGFIQSCRMQIYGMKDLLLSQEQVNNFDRAMDGKEIVAEEKKKITAAPQFQGS